MAPGYGMTLCILNVNKEFIETTVQAVWYTGRSLPLISGDTCDTKLCLQTAACQLYLLEDMLSMPFFK